MFGNRHDMPFFVVFLLYYMHGYYSAFKVLFVHINDSEFLPSLIIAIRQFSDFFTRTLCN